MSLPWQNAPRVLRGTHKGLQSSVCIMSGDGAQAGLVIFIGPPVSFVPSSLSFIATATRDKQKEFLEIVTYCSLDLFIRLLVPDFKSLDSSQQLNRIFSSCVPMEKSCRQLWFIMHPGRICLYHRSQLSFKKRKIYMHECRSAGCQEIVLTKRNRGEYEQNV